MSVGRICVREVDTASPNETAAAIAQRMHQRAVGTLVVVNDADQVVGMITDRDLVARVMARGLDPAEVLVRDTMTAAPKVVLEDTPIETAILTMRTGRLRRLPVVDARKKLLGLVTLDDVLMLLSEEFSQIGRLLKRETPRAVVENISLAGAGQVHSEDQLGVGD